MYDGTKNISLPKWAIDETNVVGGLDLLGLRNAAQTISNHCLNGITTISPEIRYLGIRSWFIKMYEKCGLPDNYSPFLDFSSKLEGAVAIGTILNKPNILGVVGGTLAKEIIDGSNNTINVIRLVKQLVLNMYTGPSIDLGICFNRDSRITGLTKERGLPLASLLMDKVENTEIVKRVLKEKKIETFSKDELKELGKILSIDEIPEDEREFLIDIVIPREPRPSGWANDIRRIATYTFLLQLADDNQALPTIDDYFITISNPSKYFDGHLKEILNGWHCYLIRDVLAVAHENALQFVVEEVKLNSQKTFARDHIINEVINDSTSIEKELKTIGLLDNNETYEQLTILNIYNKINNSIKADSIWDQGIYRWGNNKLIEPELIKRFQTSDLGAIGLIPVVWLITYFRLKDGIDEDKTIIKLLSRGGWGRLGLKEVIFPAVEDWKNKDPLYSQVLGELIGRTVDQHMRIAWSRVATDINRDVSVISVDGDKWKYKKDFFGGRTASRLSEATGWLKQLKLLGDNGITNDGKEALKRGYNSLNEYYSGLIDESA
tara:strand:+ start:89 stop:1735 length:1647 start_codon:yes stop_codon:yes gene_type:complete